MIKISKQTDYALQFLIELSKLKKGELLGLRKFSNKSSISFLFLQKIAKSLKTAGLIEAMQGKSGGYYLNKSIKRISLKEVIEAVGGQYGVADCSKDCNCDHTKTCNLKEGLDKVNKQVIKYIDSLKISDLN